VLARFRGVSILIVALSGASCAPKLMKLPSGPGEPAGDARAALSEATAACRAISNISAEVSASGSVGGRRLRGKLLAGLAAPAAVRLEAIAPFGPPIFIFVARGDDATLLLPREDRVLEHGRPDAVLGAIAGLPLDPADLRTALTGCAPSDARGAEGRRSGDEWRIVAAGSSDVYLRRDKAGPWRVVAVVHRDPNARDRAAAWRAEYRDFQDGVPRSVRLTSVDSKRFDLRLALSQIDTATALGADVFRVQIPPSAQPMTLDELRDARPGLRQD